MPAALWLVHLPSNYLCIPWIYTGHRWKYSATKLELLCAAQFGLSNELHRSSSTVTKDITVPLATPSTASNTTRLQCSASMDGALPSSTPSNLHFSGNERQYYIAAEQELWDYVPTGWDNWLGVPINVSTRVYLASYTSPQSLGLQWEKVVYRRYTGATFSVRAEDAATQGINGPTLRAEVGDMIEILFVNKLEQNYASMHSMGLGYSKANKGSLYPDATGSGTVQVTPPLGDVVAPGECVVYKWLVDDDCSPSPSEPSHMWRCHFHVDIYHES